MRKKLRETSEFRKRQQLQAQGYSTSVEYRERIKSPTHLIITNVEIPEKKPAIVNAKFEVKLMNSRTLSNQKESLLSAPQTTTTLSHINMFNPINN